MRLLTVYFFFICTHLVSAQVGSEYYQNPTDTTLYSKAFGQNRKLTIVLPTTFNSAKKTKYPLIIVFDRQNRAIFRQIVESINYLNRFDQIPEAVIVGVTTDPEQRNDETSLLFQRKTAKGEELIQFVFDELVPWSRQTYNTGSCRTLIGHSRFGYFTTVMMFRQAEKTERSYLAKSFLHGKRSQLGRFGYYPILFDSFSYSQTFLPVCNG